MPHTAGTFTQLIVHVVFAVKHRQKLIQKVWKDQLCKYISGIINGKGQKHIITNCVSDHIHILFGFTPNISLSDMIRDIKNNSTKFINQNKLSHKTFAWQNGYSAFSVSKANVPTVYSYIERQEQHHKQEDFELEYLSLIRENEITHDTRFVFEPCFE